jgi:hypothetical protein
MDGYVLLARGKDMCGVSQYPSFPTIEPMASPPRAEEAPAQEQPKLPVKEPDQETEIELTPADRAGGR